MSVVGGWLGSARRDTAQCFVSRKAEHQHKPFSKMHIHTRRNTHTDAYRRIQTIKTHENTHSLMDTAFALRGVHAIHIVVHTYVVGVCETSGAVPAKVAHEINAQKQTRRTQTQTHSAPPPTLTTRATAAAVSSSAANSERR